MADLNLGDLRDSVSRYPPTHRRSPRKRYGYGRRQQPFTDSTDRPRKPSAPGRDDLKTALQRLNIHSVFDIVRLSESNSPGNWLHITTTTPNRYTSRPRVQSPNWKGYFAKTRSARTLRRCATNGASAQPKAQQVPPIKPCSKKTGISSAPAHPLPRSIRRPLTCANSIYSPSNWKKTPWGPAPPS